MNYKGKVVDTPVAPMTSTGKSVRENTECVYTEDDTTKDLFNEHIDESAGGSGKKKSY